jgi:hypothetical protein
MLGLMSGASSALLAFSDTEPNEDAMALSPMVGWLMLLGACAVVALFILNSERWRRFWLQKEDPRSIGLYRIVFGFFVICNMNDFWEYFTFLFTDEGIFTADVARQVHASSQFIGFGDGLTEDEPWGFFDVYGVIEFLKGPKYSLLYFWDTPTFFWAHLWAFEIIAALFMIGLWTRVTGVLTFFLMNSIFFRNHLFWEGTGLVYRVFLAYLICARAGHAYSVDNWLRCRKLRKKGLLSERDGPGGGAGAPPSEDHPSGLQAIYRAIPAWPRRLAMLQLGCVYAFTGIVKNGSVWAKGDAIYYAWNLDHFYRFYPQKISAMFGTSALRVLTWTSHWGEAFFAVVLLSVFYWWAKQEGFVPAVGWRKLAIRLCLLTLVGVTGGLIWVVWPVHFTPNLATPGGRGAFVGLGSVSALVLFWALASERLESLPAKTRRAVWLAALGVAIGIAVALFVSWPLSRGGAPAEDFSRRVFVPFFCGFLVLLWLVWVRLGRRGIEVRGRWVIDRDWVMKWIFGRRIWILWHLQLMGGIMLLMNIGHFQTGMLAQTFIFFSGYEVAKGLRFLGRRVPGVARFVPASARLSEPPIPPEDPALPSHPRDAARFPQWAMWATALIVLTGVIVKVQAETAKAAGEPHWGIENWSTIWLGALLFAAGVAFQRRRAARGKELPPEDPETGVVQAPMAYGPIGRFVIGGLLLWHITAVAVWVSPDKDSLEPWRARARQVFAKYLTVTQTDQGWGMFAPNPPRSNVFLKVLVTDQNGEVFDMKSDVYAPERKPIPWIWNDRMRKMNRRIIGGESGNTQWYRKWFARWHCRNWQLEHGGEFPMKVELVKVWYKIPSPEEVAEKGWYIPEQLYEQTKTEKVEHTEHCKRTVMGQLPDFVRERHGLPPLPEDSPYKPWVKNKKKKWETHLEKNWGVKPDESASAPEGDQATAEDSERDERRERAERAREAREARKARAAAGGG